MPAMPPKFDITRPQIEAVVANFYARIRDDAHLGPVFAAHVTDWDAHEEKIARFWANMILNERQYDGNPLLVHRAAGNVRPGMFEPWLALFDQVLEEELSPGQAKAWSGMAHRIGQTLRAGMAMTDKGEGGAPMIG